VTVDSLLLTLNLTNDRPVLSSERAPHMGRTQTFKKKELSGLEPQTGLDTKTDRLTDRQLQCDFDSVSDTVGVVCFELWEVPIIYSHAYYLW
jgi:hypothetical protein